MACDDGGGRQILKIQDPLSLNFKGFRILNPKDEDPDCKSQEGHFSLFSASMMAWAPWWATFSSAALSRGERE